MLGVFILRIPRLMRATNKQTERGTYTCTYACMMLDVCTLFVRYLHRHTHTQAHSICKIFTPCAYDI